MLVDAHAHLHMYREEEVGDVLAELDVLDIRTMAVSMDLETYDATTALAARTDRILPAFGVHPEHAPDYVNRLDEVTEAAGRTPYLGEIGLDHRFVTDERAYAPQRVVFDHLLALAADQDKVVNLHTAGAEHEVADRLAHFGVSRAIVHWYSGPLDAFERLLDLGCYFTFGPEVGSSDHIAGLARVTPPKRLLTETDNPGGPEWLGLGRGRPALIRSVVSVLARVRATTEDQLTSQVAANFERLTG
jgi:TatD DNase family protein